MNAQLKRDLKLFQKEQERLCDFVRKEIKLILERLAKRLNKNKKIEWHCGMGLESLVIKRDHDGRELIYITNGSILYAPLQENMSSERSYLSLPEIKEMYDLIEGFEEVMGQVADYGWVELRGTKDA